MNTFKTDNDEDEEDENENDIDENENKNSSSSNSKKNSANHETQGKNSLKKEDKTITSGVINENMSKLNLASTSSKNSTSSTTKLTAAEYFHPKIVAILRNNKLDNKKKILEIEVIKNN